MIMKDCDRIKSTLGFSPESKREPSNWMTTNGHEQFIQLIQTKLDTLFGENIFIDDKTELLEILDKTIMVRGDENDIIDEVVEYCFQMCVGRVNMGRKLESMKDDIIRLEPRGCYGREKGCLPSQELRSVANGSMYTKFLEEQRKFR